MTKIPNRIVATLSKNSPYIFSGMAIGGIFATTIMAVKATPKAMRLLKEEEEILGHKLTAKDKIRVCWKLYLPSLLTALASSAFIIAANKAHLRKHAAVAALCTITETAYKEYRDKVVETIGKNKEQKVRDEINHDRIIKNPSNSSEIILTGTGKVKCYDALSGRYFESDHETIRKIVNDLNMRLRDDMFIELNDFYYELRLPENKLGRQVGWDIDKGYLDPRFSSCLDSNGQPCLVIDFEVQSKEMR